ncbi:hypothetical protein FF38_12643 [Lucilia cuprina]|uniref:PiggyBac transposable element-derived protein domain-containing protein n=1 Tax=Lucilia cuprina TaxID=7375 RepID=A0A0L0C4G5_LUCCU|nr:hypothetical protein FF38_12643 [Lucilia cuprina]
MCKYKRKCMKVCPGSFARVQYILLRKQKTVKKNNGNIYVPAEIYTHKVRLYLVVDIKDSKVKYKLYLQTVGKLTIYCCRYLNILSGHNNGSTFSKDVWPRATTQSCIVMHNPKLQKIIAYFAGNQYVSNLKLFNNVNATEAELTLLNVDAKLSAECNTGRTLFSQYIGQSFVNVYLTTLLLQQLFKGRRLFAVHHCMRDCFVHKLHFRFRLKLQSQVDT